MSTPIVLQMETRRSTPRFSEFWNNNVDSSFADNRWHMCDSWLSHCLHLVCSFETRFKNHMQAIVAMCALWASFSCLHYDMRNTFNRACLTTLVKESCKNNSLQHLSVHVFSWGCSLATSVEARRPRQREWRQPANIKKKTFNRNKGTVPKPSHKIARRSTPWASCHQCIYSQSLA